MHNRNKKAIKWTREAAEQGYHQAQYNLAYCYEKGIGVTEDLDEAVKWYKKAANKGNVEAPNKIATFQNKSEQQADNRAILRKYKNDVEQGDAESQLDLGWMYLDGIGVSKDEKKVAKWFQKASDQGLEAATKALEFIPETAKNQL